MKENFLKVSFEKNYKVFFESSKPFNLNIVGWRNRVGRVNHFDDLLAVYWQDNTRWMELVYSVTTKPGLQYLWAPINKKGAALLVPGQYEKAYTVGAFKGYKCLRQQRPVKVYRDFNLDSVIDVDPATIEEGLFGIHIHKAGIFNKLVGGASAGCQVFQKSSDFAQFMNIVSIAEKYWGSEFTYTLMEF